MKDKLVIENFPCPVELKRSPERKRTIGFRFSEGEEGEKILVVTAPMRVSAKNLRDIITTKLSWVQKKIELHNIEKIKKVDFGISKIMFCGKEYEIFNNNLSENSDLFNYNKEVFVLQSSSFTKEKVIIDHEKQIISFNNLHPEKNLPRLKAFLKQEAIVILTKQTELFSQQHGLKFTKISVGDMKAVWGSCSYDNKIKYNYKLILLPSYLQEYVVAHEVSHIIHKDHSSNFWKLVEKIYPQYKQARKDMKLWKYVLDF